MAEIRGDKIQYYSDIANMAAAQLTDSRENWTNYLKTAGRLYKYQFHEQLMIYTQRPDATAVASYDTWSKRTNRHIKYGSKGIALIDKSGDKPAIRYVFDVADTSGRNEKSLQPFLWQMKSEYESTVAELFADSYGELQGTLADKLFNTAQKLISDYYSDNGQDININVADFCKIASVSTAYNLMARCGLNADEYFTDEDFTLLSSFNTLEETGTLGIAVSEVSEQVLRDIESVIKKYEKSKRKELENDETDRIHTVKELSDTVNSSKRTAGEANRQIRADEAELSQQQPENPVQYNDSQGTAIPAPAGDRPNSEREIGADNDGTDNTQSPARQSGESNGMDGSHEQSAIAGGGNNPDGADLHLKLEQAYKEWDEYASIYITTNETVLNAAVNSDKENTLDEIIKAIAESKLYLSSIYIKNNNGRLANEVDRYFNAERMSALSEQLYNAVLQSDGYKLLTENKPEQSAITIANAIPFNEAVIDIFVKKPKLYYAVDTDGGSLYISDGRYLMKTAEQDINAVTAQINSRRRNSDIEAVSNKKILDYINNAKGNYELTQKPHELETDKNLVSYIYTDEKQYFKYDKKYVDIFSDGENRLFVDDNSSYDVNSHSLVIKNRHNEILGMVLPIKVKDEAYEHLNNVLPLAGEIKSEIERIKENPANDPYIGREFNDGKDDYIISGIRNHNREDKYIASTVKDGKLSAHADLIPAADIENRIMMWESNRIFREKEKEAAQMKTQAETAVKAEYENTNGYADNMPPMQKSNVLKALDNSFYTKDYGNLNVKQFIEAAVKDGKTVEIIKSVKKKYADMSVNEYLNNDVKLNTRREVWERHKSALDNAVNPDNINAVWLKENHPFLHYKIFRDTAVLDDSYLNTEYRLKMSDNTSYQIPKTAYDYGTYLIDNTVFEQKQAAEISVDSEPQTNDITVITAFAEITQTDIDAAIVEWNGNADSKQLLYDYMRENGRAREAADWLKEQFGGNLAEFTVTKDGAEPVSISWAKVQKRIIQIINDSDKYISDIPQTDRKNTIPHRIYRELDNLAPEVISGQYDYMRFQAGERFMPLTFEKIGTDRFALMHYYMQEGDVMRDPDMEIVIDRGNQTAHAMTFTQHPYIYQQTDPDNPNAELQRDLNSFLNTWLINIKNQEYQPEVARYYDKEKEEEIELNFNENIETETENENSPIFLSENTQESETIPDTAETVTQTENAVKPNADNSKSANRRQSRNFAGQQSLFDVIDDIENEPVKSSESSDNQQIETFGGIDSVYTETILQINNIPAQSPENAEVAAGKPANFKITDDNLGVGGAKLKYAWNTAAIRTLKQIESENRYATPDEQQILSRYVGWGGMPQAFDKDNKDWTNEYTELYSLLTPEEYTKARASTLNAHYTSPVVIKAVYDTVERMGFTNGNILEPSCGTGNFFGLLPDSMTNSKLYGVELDSITGRIAQQIYPQADIKITGYEKTDTPDNFFDIAVGNVPFGGYSVADKRYDRHGFMIHDYFFAKTLDKVRPGGIVAFVTSKGTLDKQNPDVRKYLAQRAELLGAVRLPNTAFKANAGTEVTADIIFLKKRGALIDIEPDWVHLGTTENGIPVNSYFAENPHMILGTMDYDNMMYGNEKSTTCRAVEDADLAEQLKEAMSYIDGRIDELTLDDIAELDADKSIPADPLVRNFSYALVTPTDKSDDTHGRSYARKIGVGEVYYRENSRMTPVELPQTTLDRIKGMIALRDCTRELIDYQLNDYSDSYIEARQRQLNQLYDSFTKKYGLINDRANSLAFRNDSSYYLLCSLEILDEDGKLERKADMFTKRTIKQKTVVTQVDTASEALAVSLAEKARIDLDYMAQLTDFTHEKITADLHGVIFLNPVSRKYETADEYLSGNVREKLRTAREAAGNDPAFAVNVSALEKAQPVDLEAGEISVRLGATWIDKSYIQKFMQELLQTPSYMKSMMTVNYSEHTGEWGVSNSSRKMSNDIAATETYGTSRINGYEIIRDSLNLKDVRVYDKKTDENGKEIRVLNQDETTLAQEKQKMIKEAFKDWIFKDPDRRHTLVQLYNERFNSTRPREYDGSHLTFPGMAADIKFEPHQKNAAARTIYGGNSLYAHEVGAGKTFEIVAAAMESKRLGLCRKSMIVVPNHLTEQWASEFLRLYPTANILVTTKKDFEAKNRKKFCSKISTGDYDAVIIGYSQFEKIPISDERQERLINEQMRDITIGIEELKRNNGERFTIKNLEKIKYNLEVKLEKLMNGKQKDNVVTFEELGVDRLFVDEAHYFNDVLYRG